MAERRLDPDRLTALEATPSRVRPAFATLWNLDLAFADVVATTSEPALGAIRMAWWRERLDELDSGIAPAEPRLRAVQRQLLGRGIRGSDLSKLEDAWLPLLEPFPWGERVAEGLRLRGRILFGIGARLLGGDLQEVAACEPLGAIWSLVDGAKHCSDPRSRQFLADEARTSIAELPTERSKRIMRRMTVLAALAAHDVLGSKPLGAGGGFDRVSAAYLHLLRGSLPRV